MVPFRGPKRFNNNGHHGATVDPTSGPHLTVGEIPREEVETIVLTDTTVVCNQPRLLSFTSLQRGKVSWSRTPPLGPLERSEILQTTFVERGPPHVIKNPPVSEESLVL